jgi:hypothetical protein
MRTRTLGLADPTPRNSDCHVNYPLSSAILMATDTLCPICPEFVSELADLEALSETASAIRDIGATPHEPQCGPLPQLRDKAAASKHRNSRHRAAGSSVCYVLTIWIERLLINERIGNKIIDRHGISPAEVRSAVERVTGLDFSWIYEPERDRRNPYVIVRTKIQNRDALVVIYPTDDPMDHEWRLASVYHIDE